MRSKKKMLKLIVAFDFRCMFQTNTCPLCCGGVDVGSPRHQFVLPGCDAVSLVNHHNKTQSLSGGSVKMRHGRIDGNSDFGPNTTAFLPGSLHSRESGFQSFASSMSSVCSRVQVLKLDRLLKIKYILYFRKGQAFWSSLQKFDVKISSCFITKSVQLRYE